MVTVYLGNGCKTTFNVDDLKQIIPLDNSRSRLIIKGWPPLTCHESATAVRRKVKKEIKAQQMNLFA